MSVILLFEFLSAFVSRLNLSVAFLPCLLRFCYRTACLSLSTVCLLPVSCLDRNSIVGICLCAWNRWHCAVSRTLAEDCLLLPWHSCVILFCVFDRFECGRLRCILHSAFCIILRAFCCSCFNRFLVLFGFRERLFCACPIIRLSREHHPLGVACLVFVLRVTLLLMFVLVLLEFSFRYCLLCRCSQCVDKETQNAKGKGL